MKRILVFLLSMVAIVPLMHAYGLFHHYDFVVDRLAYIINDDSSTVTLTYVSKDYENHYAGEYFDNYYDMREVNIPETVVYDGKDYRVTAIGETTFQGCSLLSKLSIPASMAKIDSTAFKNCPALTTIEVSAGNVIYDSRGECNAIIETATNTLVLGCKGTSIPDNVTGIGENAFWGSGISSISIPPSVKSFAKNAFENCKDLTDVYITDLTAWLSSDFANEAATPLYSRYTKTTVTYNNANEREEHYATFLKQMCLYLNGQAIIHLSIPESVTEIKRYAFSNCSSIQSVTIPPSVKSIGEDAFSCLENCKSVYINDLTAWCDIDFANPGANPLFAIYYRVNSYYESTSTGERYPVTELVKSLSVKHLYLDGQPLKDLVIPEGTTRITSYAFITNPSYNQVSIPSTVQTIGSGAFQSEIYYLYGSFGDEIIGVIQELVWNAKSCNSTGDMYTQSIESLIIGEGVETLPENLAVGSKITSLSLPLSVRQIGDNAFQHCAELGAIYAQPNVAPSCLGDPFRYLQKNHITLHTTSDAMSSYFNAQVWNEFSKLQGDLVAPTHLSLDKTTANVQRQNTFKLYATVTPSNASTPITWHSSDPSIATVNNVGQVTGVKDGETDIIATCFNLRAVCHVIVADQLVVITLDKHQLEMNPNEIATLVPSISGGTATLMATSSDERVAMARLSGNLIQVLAVNPGEAVITVSTAAGVCQPDSCKVIVSGNDVPSGDVNGDGTVDISDVNIVINMMLGKVEQTASCDVTGDGQVDISDVNAVINAMLGKAGISTYTVNGVTFKMVNVEGGTFTMGATEEQLDEAKPNEKPAHDVTLSGFSIGQTEVTQELWQAVMGSNPSTITGDPQLPVEHVSWEDCQVFISTLNELTGESFRLPTEAEWEFAARGGRKSQGYKYAGSDTPDEVLWYDGNSNSTTHHVATKRQNELGLYDMSGNVWEWCQDRFGDFTEAAQVNPTGPATGERRINRGGSYLGDPTYCRVSRRNYATHETAPINCGLRLAK